MSQDLPEPVDKLDGLGRRFVHFPIACDESGIHDSGDRKRSG